ncbi:MAG TPA: hypothetical protein VN969_31975 [Streptosporangiaceae bacterium]|nr:hypothetical protein [Streptosporangiaceae bacterium]
MRGGEVIGMYGTFISRPDVSAVNWIVRRIGGAIVLAMMIAIVVGIVAGLAVTGHGIATGHEMRPEASGIAWAKY